MNKKFKVQIDYEMGVSGSIYHFIRTRTLTQFPNWLSGGFNLCWGFTDWSGDVQPNKMRSDINITFKHLNSDVEYISGSIRITQG